MARASATSASSAGTRARSAASCARASAARAEPMRSERSASSAALSSATAASVGGRPRASRSASAAAASSRRPSRSSRRAPISRACSALAWSARALERDRRRRQRSRRATEIAHGQGDLGLGDDAASARQLFVVAEGARGAAQQLAGTGMLAELSHGNAAQGQCWRVFAQGDSLEGAERVAGGQRARGCGDQGVHDGRLPWLAGVVQQV